MNVRHIRGRPGTSSWNEDEVTAEPLPETPEPVPDWLMPPAEGFVAEDLDRLPLPPRTELMDGCLVFRAPRPMFHSRLKSFLEWELNDQSPDALEVCRGMTVTLGRCQRLEPDVLIARARAGSGAGRTTYLPEEVVLVAEVVSADSMVRDRERKPQLYARAGIVHFWRIEYVEGRVFLYVYELDPATKAYSLTGIHHDSLRVRVPFDIDLDLSMATRQSPGSR